MDFTVKGLKEFDDFIKSKKEEIMKFPGEYHKMLLDDLAKTEGYYKNERINHFNKILSESRQYETAKKENPLNDMVKDMNTSLLKVHENMKKTSELYSNVEEIIQEMIKAEKKIGENLTRANESIKSYIKSNDPKNRLN